MTMRGPRQRDYFNTNGEDADVLTQSKSRARAQQDMILALFRRHPGVLYAPHEVHQLVADDATPLTSIRRAMTNLTDAGLLEKTDTRRLGTLGKYVYCWRLREPDVLLSEPLPPTTDPALF